MTLLHRNSIAGRVMVMIEDAERSGRLSRIECDTVYDLIMHSELPACFREEIKAWIVCTASGTWSMPASSGEIVDGIEPEAPDDPLQ